MLLQDRILQSREWSLETEEYTREKHELVRITSITTSLTCEVDLVEK